MTSPAGTTASFFNTFDCRSGRHCRTCRSRTAGRAFRTAVATYFHLPSTDWDCPHSRPWDFANPLALPPVPARSASEPSFPRPSPALRPGLPAEHSANSPNQASAEEAKRRFAICRACEHSRDDAFACALHPGCCFGKYRTVTANHCPQGHW